MSTPDPSATVAPPVADTPPQPTPPSQGDPSASTEQTEEKIGGVNADGIPTLFGVPIYTFDNPYGEGIGILANVDPEAKHEAGQKFESPATDQADSRTLPRSGGSAYYVDLATGKGWSVALNPEEVS